MPRIDPLQLLKCLSVLLAPDGGIKSKEEVSRLVSLMTKFSKKLVSKCIYIQILRATKSDLLDMFMGAGGWDLTHQWLLDAIMAKNHPLNCEILQLLSLCPVNVERLKSNSCPKLVKNLSLESTNESEKMLANNLVIQWMQVVRNEVDVETVSGHGVAVVDVPLVEKTAPESSINVGFVEGTNVESRTNSSTNNTDPEIIGVQPLEKQEVDSDNVQSVTVVESEEVRTEEGGGTSEESNSPWDSSVPLYKIMIRDGKQVLAKVYSDKRQSSEISAATASSHHHNVSGTVIINVTPTEGKEVVVAQSRESPVIVTPCSESVKDSEEPVKIEEAVEQVEEEEVASVSEKKVKAIAVESSAKVNEVIGRATREAKKKLKDSKPAVAPPSEKKPRLQEGTAKEKKERERERIKAKEKAKEDKKKEAKSNLQAEKDKETLAKIMIVSSAVSKTVGKIPKKNRNSEDSNGEVKKVAPAPEVRRTPKVSVSIERRNPGVTGEPRPKTVKTFNSKFRSTGLEEEVKPPPPRSATKKNTTSEKNSRISIPPRRPTPPREVYPPEKRARPGAGIVSDVASSSHVGAHGHAEELPRKGEKAVTKTNLIKAKDKAPHAYLQESDVFMDALTAVTRKEPRRRKRRISNSKDDEKVKGKESEHRKDDHGDGHYAVGTPPHSPDEKSPPVIKPSFKFYQDTLETDEDNKKTKEENNHEDENKVLSVKKEGSHSPESDGSDEDSKTRSTKKNHEHDFKDDLKRRIKQEDDEGESSGSDESSKRKDGSVKGIKGVLVYHKKLALKSKKTVRWKDDGELEKIVYFELDETERVNVTKTFMDMKQMERTHERQTFLMARKLAHEDVMEEKMTWKPLIPLLLPPPLAEPGSKSREKDVQYAREKVVLQSLYFHRDMIPDSPSEPDIENHPTTDPAIIPLNDVSGNPDSVNDFQTTPWPEPKPFQPPVASTSSHGHSGTSLPLIPGIPDHGDGSYMSQHPHQNMVQGHPMVAGGMGMQFGAMHPPQMGAHPLHAGFTTSAVTNPNMMAPMDNSMHPRSSHPINMQGSRPLLHPPNSQQLPMNNMINPNMQGVAGAGGDWRTADGKVVPVEESQPMVMYAQGGVPDVGIGGNNPPQMDGEMNSGFEMEYGVQYQEGMEEGHVGGPGYMMPPMGYSGGTGGNVRPPHGGAMYGHPPMFRGSSRGGRGGPAPSRGGPWFRPSGPMPPRGRGGNWEGGRGRGGRGGLRVTVCKHFRAGYCRNGEQCSFLHPGVNGPPVPYMYSE